MEKVLELSHVKKVYGTKVVLEDVNLAMRSGELICLSGPSGSGKTTILEIIAGFVKQDEGSCARATESIGYAFQDDCLVPWLSAEENLKLVLPPPFGIWTRGSSSLHEEGKARLQFLLDALDLKGAKSKKISQLSGGMKKRLNLARALLIEPKLLLLDEPFAFQDESFVTKIIEIIEEQNTRNGTAVILVTHERTRVLGDNLVKLCHCEKAFIERGHSVGYVKENHGENSHHHRDYRNGRTAPNPDH